jgi:hypothetical protein
MCGNSTFPSRVCPGRVGADPGTHHQLLLRPLLLLLLLCFVLKIASQHYLMDRTGCFGIVTDNFHFKKHLENFLLVFKNGQSARKREANPTHHAASLSALICYF